MKQNNAERLIIISIVGAIAFAVLGIVWGIIAQSQMIQFDGYYSFISVILSFISMIALRFIKKEDPERFPFGKESFIPLTIVIKYFGILVLIVISLVQALATLFTGGNEVAMSSGVIYAFISTVGCFIAYFYFRKHGKDSELIAAEMNQWHMDALLSLGVFVGFIIGWGLAFTPLDFIVPFVDPLMVLLVAGYFIKVPLSEMYGALRELLEMAPEHVISQEVAGHVSELGNIYSFDSYDMRLQKMGSKLYIEVDYVVPRGNPIDIRTMDYIRHQLKERLQELPLNLWTTIVFTHEKRG